MSSMQSNNARRMSNEAGYADAMKDVQQLIADGTTSVSSSLLNRLRNKYSDSNIVDMIVENLSERVNTIKVRAGKFAKAIIKGSGQNTPLHTMLKRALKYKERLGLTDAEFEFFKRILHTTLQGTEAGASSTSGFQTLNTNLSRALGNVDSDNFEGMQVEQADYPFLNEIIKLNATTKPLHSSIVIQSMMYRPFAGEAILGKYDYAKNNASCYVHPIIAAFFIPKIELFEQTFLLANLSYIVKCRHEKSQVMTSPDYLLLYSLISDPTDVVCDIESPFKDLRNRVLLQNTLWQSVLAIRNGRYYDCISSEFMSAIDNCKLNNADAPDVIYIGDEATILRRLLQAFSFRPIIISTMPIYGVVAANTANFPVMMNRVTAIPMITVRLPVMTQTDQESVSLYDSLSEPQYHLENNTLVPKVQQILYTRGVIIYHVTRRTHQPRFQRMIQPGNWTELLPTISAYEKINTRPVIAEPFIDIGFNASANGNTATEQHFLRSVVALNVSPINNDLIIGTRALLVNVDDVDASYLQYNPQLSAIKNYQPSDPQEEESSDPVTRLDYENADKPDRSFSDIASKYGTIYVYSLRSRKELESDL